jgi:hypothetical protein
MSYTPRYFSLGANQRVLNDIWGARLSRGRMIWLLAHPLPLSLVSKLDRRHTGRLRKRDDLLTGEVGKGRVRRPQKSLVLYKSLNTLWCQCFSARRTPPMISEIKHTNFSLFSTQTCNESSSCSPNAILTFIQLAVFPCY